MQSFLRSLTWFQWPYAVDWLMCLAFKGLAHFFESLPVFERSFSLDDPLISFPYGPERVPEGFLFLLHFLSPLAIVLFVALLKKSPLDAHHSALSLCASVSLSDVVVELLKNRVGRLRPDFLARCNWDSAAQICTGAADIVKDGRRSFPSGHSSSSFAGLGWLFFWIAGKTGAFALSAVLPPRSPLSSRILRIAITIWPLLLAAWVAITRLEDHRHHKEDVVTGGIIGFSSAAIAYFSYWPNPFSAAAVEADLAGNPKLPYDAPDYEGFRLAREEEDEAV